MSQEASQDSGHEERSIVKVSPWPDMNLLCDARIGRVHEKAGVDVGMDVNGGVIEITAALSRERLRALLAEEGIVVLDPFQIPEVLFIPPVPPRPETANNSAALRLARKLYALLEENGLADGFELPDTDDRVDIEPLMAFLNADGADEVLFKKTDQSPLLLKRQRRFSDACKGWNELERTMAKMWGKLVEKGLIDDRDTTRVYVTPWYESGDERGERMDGEYIRQGTSVLMGPVTYGIGGVMEGSPTFAVQVRTRFAEDIFLAMVERAHVVASTMGLKGIKIALHSKAGAREERILRDIADS
jgi:hypothetical protein